MIGQILQQAMTRAAVQEFVQGVIVSFMRIDTVGAEKRRGINKLRNAEWMGWIWFQVLSLNSFSTEAYQLAGTIRSP